MITSPAMSSFSFYRKARFVEGKHSNFFRQYLDVLLKNWLLTCEGSYKWLQRQNLAKSIFSAGLPSTPRMTGASLSICTKTGIWRCVSLQSCAGAKCLCFCNYAKKASAALLTL